MAEEASAIIQAIEAIDKRSLFNRRLTVKIILSILVAALLLTSFWGAAREKSFEALFAPLDQRAEEYLERTLIKTAFAYAGVRAAHATISFLRGTQLHPPFVTLSVGELLAPAQDMIEKLSDALMIAIVSLSTQRILMEIGSSVGLSIFVAAGAVLLLAGIWITRFQRLLFSYGARLVVLGLTARLIIPFMALGASIAGDTLLLPKYEEAIASMEYERTALSESVLPSGDASFMDKVKSWASIDALSARLESLKDRAESLAKALIALFALFVFETIIFPIASFCILYRLFFAFAPKRKD
jgi:hypothetical protein